MITRVLQLFCIIATALIAGCARPKQQLNIYIWSEYMDPAIIADFEKAFDCKVNVDLFEDPDSMIAKLAAGGDSIYDIVVPAGTTLPALIKRGLLAPLRRENIPNLKNLDPQFTNAPFDPGNRYGAPLDWGLTGIYFRKQPGAATLPETWGLLFDPALQPGPFLLMEDVRTCLGAALRYKGFSLNTTNRGELAQAGDLLIAAKKRSLGFEGGAGCKNRILSKGATLAMAYNTDALRGMREDPETAFIIPREGAEIYVDLLSIPAKAPHRDLAEKFINYLLEPKVSAQFANWLVTATANQAAKQFINPADLKNPAIYPPPEVMARLEYASDLGEYNRLYDEIWTRIKSN